MDIRILIDRFWWPTMRKQKTHRRFCAYSLSESEGGSVMCSAGQKKRCISTTDFASMAWNSSSLHTRAQLQQSLWCLSALRGYGHMLGIDPKRWYRWFAQPFTKKPSPAGGAKKRWSGSTSWYTNAHKFDFPVHKPYRQLTRLNKTGVEGNAHLKASTTFPWPREQDL